MKLICSVLILAGVLALNGASADIPIEVRIANDMAKMQEIMQIADTKTASTAACTGDYLTKLTDLLATYNTATDNCDKAKQTALDEINETTKAKLAELSTSVDGTCSSATQCSGIESALDGLGCYQSEGSSSSKLLSSVSTSAATAKVDHEQAVENVNGVEAVCTQKANADYSTASSQLDTDLQNCLAGKSSPEDNPTPAPAPAPAPTPAPEPETPEEQPEGEPETRGRSFVRPNRFNRF